MQATPHQIAQLQAMQAMRASQMQQGGGGQTQGSSSGNNIPVPQQQQQQLSMMPRPSMPPPPPPAQQLSSSKRGIASVDLSSSLSTADILKSHKRRKPTEISLPSSLLAHSDELSSLSQEYEKLLELERGLDLTLTRRKAELGDDAASGKRTVHRTLRVRISNTCEYQEWQQQQQQSEEEAPDFESGKGVPSWTCRIEGKLLDANGEELADSGSSEDSVPKLSHLVQHLSVDLLRPSSSNGNGDTGINLHREPSLLSWQPSPSSAPISGLQFTRSSTSSVPLRISLYLPQHPKRFRLSKELGELLEVREESRIGVLERLWGYIQREKLVEKGEGRGVRCDERMQRLFGNAPKMQFWQICDMVTKYMGPADPIVLSYTADVSPECESKAVVYDILLEIPDPSSRSLNTLIRSLNSPNSPATIEILRLDELSSNTVSSIRSLAYQHSLLSRFSENPVKFVNEWMDSQSLDLQDLLDEGGNGKMGERMGMWKGGMVRDSKWFAQDWVKDAVGIHVARGQQVSYRQ